MNPIKAVIIPFFIILAFQTNAQLKQTRYFSKQNEQLALCSQNLVLDSLGYFFKEEGCEGSGTVSFGRYKISKDNLVTFQFLPFDSLPPIRQIKRTGATSTGDSLITITLFDRTNKPLDYNFNVTFASRNGEPLYPATDEKGQIVLNKKTHSDIVLNSLLWIYGGSPVIVKGEESAIEIYLNLPELLLLPTEVTVAKGEPFQLLLKKEGLYEPNGRKLLYPFSK